MFSKWRLNNLPWHMMYGWEANAAHRYQHHAGTFFAGTPLMFHIYIPVGLLHSHLAFGALIMFIFPVLMFRLLDPIVESPRNILKPETLKAGLALLIASIIFLINNARSAMIGTVFAMGLGLYLYARHYWKAKSIRVAIPIALGLIAFLTLVVFAEHLHERLYSLIISLTGQEKHTDYQRILLWNSTFSLIQNNWLFGVGPGHFQSSIEAVLLQVSQANPALWYANETLQRGHAHSDLLHFVAIAGIPCLMAYLTFFALLIHRVVKQSERSFEAWKVGAAGLLVAGLYQCYFLDDAVMLPFWIMVGLTLRVTEHSVITRSKQADASP
ncbi:MAG: O-antigen ligase family protein [Spirochaetia bacterium]|nr:O-antigen ligase family protein [Spirochaetia bacterium]